MAVNTPFLTYGNLRVLNLPNAKAMFDEVLVEDCYRRASIPAGATVLDVGGHYGEFGLWCAAERGCQVRIYEPSPLFRICAFNATLNDLDPLIFNAAIGNREGPRCFVFQPEESYKSHLLEAGEGTAASVSVPCLTLGAEIATAKRAHPDVPVVVKLDCEGAEREIFEDERWLSEVQRVMVEFHNKDGDYYRATLRRHGFTVDSTDNNPECWRATIYAERT